MCFHRKHLHAARLSGSVNLVQVRQLAADEENLQIAQEVIILMCAIAAVAIILK